MNLKKLFFVFIIVSLLVFSSVPPVFANAPMPADHLTVVLSNIPDDVMYADLLIKISNDDPNFVDFCNGLEYQDHLTHMKAYAIITEMLKLLCWIRILILSLSQNRFNYRKRIIRLFSMEKYTLISILTAWISTHGSIHILYYSAASFQY